MTLTEFRIAHSCLIEQYQYIEFHLEGIYAFSNEKFSEAIEDVERDSMSRLLRRIQDWEKKQKLNIFTKEEYARLRRITTRRNFWSHECYTKLPFNRRDGSLKSEEDIQTLAEDTEEAKKMRSFLKEKEKELGKIYIDKK